MKKKTYQQPEIKVVKLEQTDIICASGGFNDGDFQINGGEDLLLDEEEWLINGGKDLLLDETDW